MILIILKLYIKTKKARKRENTKSISLSKFLLTLFHQFILIRKKYSIYRVHAQHNSISISQPLVYQTYIIHCNNYKDKIKIAKTP